MTTATGDVMESKTDDFVPAPNPIKEGSGKILATERKKQKKTVEEIATELNLSVSQIETIELDQNEGLPEPTYVRGYIRSYANLLGLNAEKVLESYLNPNWQKNSSLDDIPKGIANADDASARGFLSPVKVIVFVLIVLAVLFLWFSGAFSNFASVDDRSDGDETISTTAVSDIDTSESSSENSVSNLDQTAVLVDEISETREVSVEESVKSETQADEIANLAAVQTDPKETIQEDDKPAHNLTLKFIETCWVDIRDNTDKRLAYKSFYAGEELTVSHENRLNVFLGNAEGVTAIYNGEPFDMSSYREGVYAKFSLK